MASKESILFLKTNLEVKNNKNVIELKLFKKKCMTSETVNFILKNMATLHSLSRDYINISRGLEMPFQKLDAVKLMV